MNKDVESTNTSIVSIGSPLPCGAQTMAAPAERASLRYTVKEQEESKLVDPICLPEEGERSRDQRRSNFTERTKAPARPLHSGRTTAPIISTLNPTLLASLRRDNICRRPPLPRDSGYSTSPSTTSREDSVGSTRSSQTSPRLSLRDETLSRITSNTASIDLPLAAEADCLPPNSDHASDSKGSTGSATPRDRSVVRRSNQPEEHITAFIAPIPALPRCESPTAMLKSEISTASSINHVEIARGADAESIEPVLLGQELVNHDDLLALSEASTFTSGNTGREEPKAKAIETVLDRAPSVETGETMKIRKSTHGRFWSSMRGFARKAMKPFISCFRGVAVHAMPGIASIPQSSDLMRSCGPILIADPGSSSGVIKKKASNHSPEPQDADNENIPSGGDAPNRSASHKRQNSGNGRGRGAPKRSRGAGDGLTPGRGDSGDPGSDPDSDSNNNTGSPKPLVCPIWAHDPINADPSCKNHEQNSIFRLKSGTLGRTHGYDVSSLPRLNSTGLSVREAYNQLYSSMFPRDIPPVSPFAEDRVDIIIQRVREKERQESSIKDIAATITSDVTEAIILWLDGRLGTLETSLRSSDRELAASHNMLEKKFDAMQAYWSRIDKQGQGQTLSQIAADTATKYARQYQAQQDSTPRHLLRPSSHSDPFGNSLPADGHPSQTRQQQVISAFGSSGPGTASSSNISRSVSYPDPYHQSQVSVRDGLDLIPDASSSSLRRPTQRQPQVRHQPLASFSLSKKPSSGPVPLVQLAANSNSNPSSGSGSQSSSSHSHSLIPAQIQAEPSPPNSNYQTTPDPSTATATNAWQNQDQDQNQEMAFKQHQQEMAHATGIVAGHQYQNQQMRVGAEMGMGITGIGTSSTTLGPDSFDLYSDTAMDLDMNILASNPSGSRPRSSTMLRLSTCEFKDCDTPVPPGQYHCDQHATSFPPSDPYPQSQLQSHSYSLSQRQSHSLSRSHSTSTLRRSGGGGMTGEGKGTGTGVWDQDIS